MTTSEKYTAISRRFRPETFDKVLGQEHVIRVLKSQLKNNSIAHAYLFCGTRGTGKTTVARLLAKGVNCLSAGDENGDTRPCGVCDNCVAIRDGAFVDVIEIDAASNNSVDNVRDLRDSVIYPPAVGKKKVYIIDEVHMFSKGAFNALLKTLEEPPDHVMFILATTEPGKLPATIKSRCLRFDFKRVPMVMIKRGMGEICTELGVAADDDALALLAQNADGSVRDGLSLLEQCTAAGTDHITRDLVLDVVGSPGDTLIADLTEAVHKGDATKALIMLDAMIADGKEERRIIEDWIEYFHSALLIKYVNDPGRMINRSVENIAEISERIKDFETPFINDSIYSLSKLLNDTRWAANVRILLEMAIIDLSDRSF